MEQKQSAAHKRRNAWKLVLGGLAAIGASILFSWFSYDQAKDALQYSYGDTHWTMYWQPAVAGVVMIAVGLFTLGKPADMLEAEQPPAE
jgi:hypothetical protein